MRNLSSLLVCSYGGQNKAALMAFSPACCFFLSPLKMLCPKWELTSDSLVSEHFLNAYCWIWFQDSDAGFCPGCYMCIKEAALTSPTCTFTQLLSFHQPMFWPLNPAFSPLFGDLYNMLFNCTLVTRTPYRLGGHSWARLNHAAGSEVIFLPCCLRADLYWEESLSIYSFLMALIKNNLQSMTWGWAYSMSEKLTKRTQEAIFKSHKPWSITNHETWHTVSEDVVLKSHIQVVLTKSHWRKPISLV